MNENLKITINRLDENVNPAIIMAYNVIPLYFHLEILSNYVLANLSASHGEYKDEQ